MKRRTNWHLQAHKAAAHVYDACFHVHRGAMSWRAAVAVFGNDGYSGSDGRAKAEVDILRQFLADAGIVELAFATDDGEIVAGGPVAVAARGYSWALLVQADDSALDRLTQMVRDAWAIACQTSEQPAPAAAIAVGARVMTPDGPATVRHRAYRGAWWYGANYIAGAVGDETHRVYPEGQLSPMLSDRLGDAAREDQAD